MHLGCFYIIIINGPQIINIPVPGCPWTPDAQITHPFRYTAFWEGGGLQMTVEHLIGHNGFSGHTHTFFSISGHSMPSHGQEPGHESNRKLHGMAHLAVTDRPEPPTPTRRYTAYPAAAPRGAPCRPLPHRGAPRRPGSGPPPPPGGFLDPGGGC